MPGHARQRLPVVSLLQKVIDLIVVLVYFDARTKLRDGNAESHDKNSNPPANGQRYVPVRRIAG